LKPGRWPPGEGETARLIREHDWAATPLGPIGGWPQGLKALVDLVLASESVMCLMWGKRAISIYNDAYASAIGARHPGALGRSAFEAWADARPVFEPLFERAYGAGETAAERDLRLSFAGGVPSEEAWFDLTYTPVPDERGKVLGVLATLAETTDRVLAMRELADTKVMLEEGERRYRAFVTASSDVVYRMGPDWAGMRRLDGRGFISDTAEPTEDWMGRYIHPEDRTLVKATIEEAVRTKGVFELEHRVVRVDGTLGWTLSRAVPILGAGGEVLEWLGTASDVTARRKAEAALREGEERQAFLLKLSDVLRPLRDPVAIQKQASRILGEHLAVDRCGYCEADESATWITCHRDYHAAGMPSFAGTYRMDDFGKSIVDPLRIGQTVAIDDGAEHPAFADPMVARAFAAADTRGVVGAPLVKEGALVAIFFVHHRQPRHWTRPEIALIEEIAERTWSAVERARAEEASRESESRLHTALEAAELGTFLYHPQEDRGEPDARMLAHFGLPEGGTLNLAEAMAKMIHPDDRLTYAEAVARATDPNGDGFLNEEIRVIHPDESLRWIAVTAQTHFGGVPPRAMRMYGTAADVTERRELERERERLRARELTALAEAAERERISRELHDRVAHHMGVAHQSLELFAALREAAPERAAERLALARETTRLALDQTRALSAELKRLQEEELENGLRAAFGALAEGYVPDAIEVDLSFSGDESEIPNHVAMQVYLAMREAIRNAVSHSGCSRIGVSLEVSDGEVAGSVQDDGRGFDPEAVGQATPSWGVGLRSMRERAEMLGGSLRVDSSPGDGTTVEVSVPLDGQGT
jgi:signal transduction histidine kinase